MPMITRQRLDALRTDFSLLFGSAYTATTIWSPRLASDVQSDSKSTTYGWLAQQLAMREWIGPRVVQNLAEHDYQVPNKPYEATVELSKFDIEDDILGVFRGMTIPQLAFAAKKLPDRNLKALIQSSTQGFDGVSLFNDSHPTFAPPQFTQTYDNLHTQDLDGDGVQAVYAAMASFTGEDGNPLGIVPNLLIVPPQLARNAYVVANSTTYAIPGVTTGLSVAVDNPLRGMFDVLMVPELANEPNNWYMADTTKPIKPFVRQIRQAANFVSRDNPEDPKVFDQAVFTYGVDAREAMAITLPFLIAKAIHTP